MRYYVPLLLSSLFLILSLKSVDAQCNQLVWADEFDGTSLDVSNWGYDLGNGCPSICGWGNGELEYYTTSNVSVSSGSLKITATESGGNYYSGKILTRGKKHWTTGRIEARIKMPTGQGIWPAFWMLAEENHYGAWPLSGEIDITEMIGNEPARTHGTLHYGRHSPLNQSTGGSYAVPSGDLADGFHDYVLEWDETSIKWYLDGVLYSTKTAFDLGGAPWIFDRDFFLILNIAVGGYWPGYPDASTVFPQVMEVDYIRIYQDLGETIISGPDRLAGASERQQYYAQNYPGATYNWTVPTGGSITAGQGTPEVTVNWGQSSGDISVDINHAGCATTVSKTVEVLFDACESNVMTHETRNWLYWLRADGALTENVGNPAPDAVNSTFQVSRYTRNPSLQYDVLGYSVDFLRDADDLVDGSRLLMIDVYTNAPIGSEVLFQLENNPANYAPYPAGRQAVLRAYTTSQNQWETLALPFLLQPDASISEADVNQLLMLFQPGLFVDNTWHFDNLRIVDNSCSYACNDGNAPDGLGATEVAAGVELSWNAVDNSIGCQVSGGPIGGPLGQLSFFGLEPSSTVIPASFLTPGDTYQWAVRCACELDPVNVTPFSFTGFFTPSAPRFGDRFVDLESSSLLRSAPYQTGQQLFFDLNLTKDAVLANGHSALVRLTNVVGQEVASACYSSSGLHSLPVLSSGMYWLSVQLDGVELAQSSQFDVESFQGQVSQHQRQLSEVYPVWIK